MKKAIGVFDSGMGGISVLGDLILALPNESFIYYGDSAKAPYGDRSKEAVKQLTIDACDFLIDKGVKAIVIACNTATSAAIKDIRSLYDIPIIGMEPAIKLAIEGEDSDHIAVMATELTLKEDKFNALVEALSGKENIIKVPCPEIVRLVEEGVVSGNIMKETIKKSFERAGAYKFGAIVLGCTHYLFIKNVVQQLYPDKVIYHGNVGTVNQVKRLLSSENTLSNYCNRTTCKIYTSHPNKGMIILMRKMLNNYLIM